MHSRIFELKDDKETQNELFEDTIEYDLMQSHGIDYVSEIKKRYYGEQIEWLQSSCKGIDTSAEKLTVRFSDVKALMQDSFDEFKSVLNEINNMDINDFVSNKSRNDYAKSMQFLMYRLEQAYSDEAGFYIYYHGVLSPLNKFVRNYADDYSCEITGKTLYIGNILDYHY